MLCKISSFNCIISRVTRKINNDTCRYDVIESGIISKLPTYYESTTVLNYYEPHYFIEFLIKEGDYYTGSSHLKQ